MRKFLQKTLLACPFFLCSISPFASDGQTWGITESSPLENLREESFQGKKVEKEHAKKVLSYLYEPPAVSGLSEVREYHRFYYDPIYQVQEDITDLEGRLIAEKGTLVNPLDQIDILQDLLFFDGTNPKHLKLAKKEEQAKWILVKGSPLDVEESTDHQTFFDQMGMLCRQFGITKIPAKVSKEGKRILIEELACDD